MPAAVAGNMTTTIASSSGPSRPNLNDVTPQRRARELYQYFHPMAFEDALEIDDASDRLLTSQAQLVALRLGGKVLINFLDNARQYIVAEADLDHMAGFRGSLDAMDKSLSEAFTSPRWIEVKASLRPTGRAIRLTIF